MHKFVSFDHGIVAADEASVSAFSSGSLYGKGIFTTVAIYNRQPFLFEKHWRRLETNADSLNLDLSRLSAGPVQASLAEILQKNDCINGRARITFFDDSPGNIWPFESIRKTILLIITGERRQRDDIRLTLSPHAVNSCSPLAGVKSCNYLDKIFALDEATSRGFDETIQLNERGEVTSAAMANVFWLRAGELYTPSLRTGCLAGTMREFVLENAECSEVETGLDEIRNADSVFLTSSGLGVAQVLEFESRKFKPTDHAILNLLPKDS